MSNEKVSFILPARNEKWLTKTIQDILAKCKGDIEVIAVLEGYWPDEIVQDDRVKYLHHGTPKGLRGAVNAGVAISTGKYICKIDAHCLVDEGFDEKLKVYSAPKRVQVPQRRRLDAENWCEQIQDNPQRKPHIDYEYLSYPDDPKDFGGASMTGKIWTEKIHAKKDVPYDLSASFQGSCWFMEKDFFYFAGFMNDKLYGDFWQESQEIVLNTFLNSGGECCVNKTTFYCHWHKGKEAVAADGRKGRGYHLREQSLKQGRDAVMRFYAGEKVYPNQQYPLSYFISLFPDMPGWTAERVEALKQRERDKGWNV